MENKRNSIWIMSPKIPFSASSRSITVILSAIGVVTLCCGTWYFGYHRPTLERYKAGYEVLEHGTTPMQSGTQRVKESQSPTQEMATLKFTEQQTTDLASNKKTQLERESAVTEQHPNNVETTSTPNVTSKEGRQSPEQKAHNLKAARILDQMEAELEKLNADVAIFEPLLSLISEGSELSDTELEGLQTELMPLVVKQLNSFSANEQLEALRELIHPTNPMHTNASATEEKMELLLKLLHEHGFQQKF